MLNKLVLGTYLGEENQETDKKIIEVLSYAYNNGVRFYDTAPNYRNARSEKCIGAFIQENNLVRDSLKIGTKGGFIPYNFKNTNDEKEISFLKELTTKIKLPLENIDTYYFQCFHPNYLKFEFTNSLKRLRSEYIDVYYLHNPEYLLRKVGEDEFYLELKRVFEWIKTEIKNNKIKTFGISSWDGFFSNEELNLQISKLYNIANSIGIADKFKCIQFPFNLLENRAFLDRKQKFEGVLQSTVSIANKLNIECITSACFGQGQINKIKTKIDQSVLPGDNIHQQAINYAFTAPGISNLIIGTSNVEHLNENIKNISRLTMSDNYFINLLKK